MTLENVWAILEKGEWESKQALREASGVDDDILSRIISFLDRWKFVEIQRSPELRVRRKAGTISPVEMFNVLRVVTTDSPIPVPHRKLAERIACRSCGGRSFNFTGGNEVECVQCHEKQWYALEARTPLTGLEETEPTVQPTPTPSPLTRILVRLGLPQRAFQANSPNPLQYFWFRCTGCGRVRADYPHSHSRYLTCDSCGTRSHFW